MPKILVIDDEKSVRLTVVDLLKYEGFEVIAAVDGESGLKAAFNESPDLILCDIMMPKVDGYEVLRSLRSNPAMVMTPFIFLSALIEKKETELGLNLGADDYVEKPFDPVQLIQRIRSRLEKFRRMKDSLNQVRANLIGKVPHEFKTPLNGILGFASMMKENALMLNPSEVRDFSALIVESGERMLQTVVNYVRYLELQIDLGQDELPVKYTTGSSSIDQEEIQSVLHNLETQHGQRKGEVDLYIHPARLLVGRDDLIFMVHQLLDNALKFSSPNSKVNLNTIVDSNYYVISIADRGQGMNEDEISSLGPFIQLNRDEQEQQGLGLGLSIVESLCRLYAGSMSITSQTGEGTRVILRLPMDEDS